MKKATSKRPIVKYLAIALIGWLCVLALFISGDLASQESNWSSGINRPQVIAISSQPESEKPGPANNGVYVHLRSFAGDSFKGAVQVNVDGEADTKALAPYRSISLAAPRFEPIGLTRAPNGGGPLTYLEFQSGQDAPFSTFSANGHGDFYYPWDAYCVSFKPEFIALESDNGTLPIRMHYVLISSELPGNYRLRYGELRNQIVTSKDQTVNEYRCNLADDQNPDITKLPELVAYIDHPIWFRCFVWLMVSILFAPILLLFRSDSSSLSMDVLAGFVSVITVRTIVLGSDIAFHFLDFFIGGALLVIAVVPLIKFIKSGK